MLEDCLAFEATGNLEDPMERTRSQNCYFGFCLISFCILFLRVFSVFPSESSSLAELSGLLGPVHSLLPASYVGHAFVTTAKSS